MSQDYTMGNYCKNVLKFCGEKKNLLSEKKKKKEIANCSCNLSILAI